MIRFAHFGVIAAIFAFAPLARAQLACPSFYCDPFGTPEAPTADNLTGIDPQCLADLKQNERECSVCQGMVSGHVLASARAAEGLEQQLAESEKRNEKLRKKLRRALRRAG